VESVFYLALPKSDNFIVFSAFTDDNKKEEVREETTRSSPASDFSAWNDFTSGRVQDKTEIVKQGIQTLQVDDWDNWGSNNDDDNSKSIEDDKKRQREEKRIQRQKEIESKRAARKGPMKLGAKKTPESDFF
jgi:hypothetical protein